jgi:DNA-binding response OmpR family regulator
LKGELLNARLDDVKILVVEDNAAVLGLLERAFSQAGAQVYVAMDGREAMRQFYACRPDLVILDVMLPLVDGWTICHQIRLFEDCPIIFLTALQSEHDVLRGLDCGAVDYVTKPFSPKVLIARAQIALRKGAAISVPSDPFLYQDDYLTVDRANRRVLVNGQSVELTATEYRLLDYLIEHAGRVLTHAQILEQVWGWEYRDSVDYLHVYISRLRNKLEQNTKNPRYLLTRRGEGYLFDAQTGR